MIYAGGEQHRRRIRAKDRVHRAFDPLWKSGWLSRTLAYRLLARHMGISRRECHIGHMSTEQCYEALVFCNEVSKACHLEEMRGATE